MIMIVAVAASSLVVATYAFHLFGGVTNCGCGSTPTNNSPGAHFTVVMSLNGFNDSKTHGGVWPIMNVTLGENVTIHLVNCDTTQSHGFWIMGITKSVTVAPGRCLDLTFTADSLGAYHVICTIFCTVHISMLNGKFNVNP